MKVIKVIGSLDFGGIEKVFEITARYYRGDKDDIVFLCLGNGGAAETVIRSLGYRVEVWHTATRIPRLRLIGRLARFFREERPDVVHCTGAEANFHGVIAAWWRQVPVRVAEEIGMPSHSRLAQAIFRRVYRRATGVIAVAELVKDYLVSRREAPTARVHVIYNPVDVEAFGGPRCEPAGVFRIVSVCRLDPIKNLPLLIRALPATTGVELWLVGDGKERAALTSLAASLGVSDRVTFLGFQAAPAAFLSQASLFVLPSFSEGIPLSVAEAMLMGTPCLMTRVGGGPEFIRPGENGWLLDPHDQDGFNRRLQEIACLPAAQRSAVGLRGKATAEERFQPAGYLRSVWALYANNYGKDQDITLP